MNPYLAQLGPGYGYGGANPDSDAEALLRARDAAWNGRAQDALPVQNYWRARVGLPPLPDPGGTIPLSNNTGASQDAVGRAAIEDRLRRMPPGAGAAASPGPLAAALMGAAAEVGGGVAPAAAGAETPEGMIRRVAQEYMRPNPVQDIRTLRGNRPGITSGYGDLYPSNYQRAAAATQAAQVLAAMDARRGQVEAQQAEARARQTAAQAELARNDLARDPSALLDRALADRVAQGDPGAMALLRSRMPGASPDEAPLPAPLATGLAIDPGETRPKLDPVPFLADQMQRGRVTPDLHAPLLRQMVGAYGRPALESAVGPYTRVPEGLTGLLAQPTYPAQMAIDHLYGTLPGNLRAAGLLRRLLQQNEAAGAAGR